MSLASLHRRRWALWLAGPAAALLGWGGAGAAPGIPDDVLNGLTIKPQPKCMGPRRNPDPSIPLPVVESIYPARGAVVRPGVLVVRITFNVAMSCTGIFLKRTPFEKPCGEARRQDVRLSYDRRTLRMKCMVAPSRRYGFRLNNDPDDDQLRPGLLGYVNFVSLAGGALKPFELTFATSSGPKVTSVEASEADDKGAPANAPEIAVGPP